MDRIEVFDSQFNYLREWFTPYAGSHLALSPDGQFAFLDYSRYPSEGSMFEFDTATGNQVATWGVGLRSAYGFDTGPNGAIYVGTDATVTAYGLSSRGV